MRTCDKGSITGCCAAASCLPWVSWMDAPPAAGAALLFDDRVLISRPGDGHALVCESVRPATGISVVHSTAWPVLPRVLIAVLAYHANSCFPSQDALSQIAR